jgi:hypothetical protein
MIDNLKRGYQEETPNYPLSNLDASSDDKVHRKRMSIEIKSHIKHRTHWH